MIHILIACTNQPIAATIARLIEKMENWKATVALSINDAQEQCLNKTYDLVLIGAGISDDEEETLRHSLKQVGTKIVKHYGGGSGLLYAEIYQALGQ